MISVEEALARCLALVQPLGHETLGLRAAAARVLASPVAARLTQPPFAASAMDGYALGSIAQPGARFAVIGTSSAGHAFAGDIGPDQAARIFTGAPLPEGAVSIALQEDVAVAGGEITLATAAATGDHIRPRGQDFSAGAPFFPRRRLTPFDVALLAAMNVPEVPLIRRPVVAIIATGDELVMPGEPPRPDQIVASNHFALAAMVEAAGGEARLLPVARDTEADLRTVFALAAGADLIVTIGGASVGDHDLVGRVAADLGMERAFWQIAMRPGKPLMAGRLLGTPMLGLPGNPVSAIVSGHIFVLPMIAAMLGLPQLPRTRRAALAEAMPANGIRSHYMRARLSGDLATITPHANQDSALLSVLCQSDALLIRPVGDPARAAGDSVEYLPL